MTALRLEKLQALRELKARAASAVVSSDERRLGFLRKHRTGLDLACELNPRTVRTPALEIIAEALERAATTPGTRLIISIPPQEGKAVDCSEQVLTTAGWSTMGELAVGDEVFHPDGQPVRVVEAHDVLHDRDCYRVTTTDGRSLVVDAEHLWTVQDRSRRGGGPTRNAPAPRETVTTTALIERGVLSENGRRSNGAPHRAYRFMLPRQNTIESPDQPLPIDPYVLGAWLGDGSTRSAGFTCADPQIVDEIRAAGLDVLRAESGGPYAWWISRQTQHREALERARVLVEQEGVPGAEALRRVGLPVGAGWDGERPRRRTDTRACVSCLESRRPVARGLCSACYQRCSKDGTLEQYPPDGDHAGHWRRPELYAPRIRPFQTDLRELGVLGNKHIPDSYLTAGTEQRLALLQGLMDTDGSIYRTTASSRAEFTSTNRELAVGVLTLVRSLGWRATSKESAAKLNGREVSRRWRVCFTPQRDELEPFRLARKAERVQEGNSRGGERHAVSIASIEPVESRPVRCIKVDRDDGLFLAGRDLVATHNTTSVLHALVRKLQRDPEKTNAIASYGADLAVDSGRDVRQMIDTHGSRSVDPLSGESNDKLGIAVRQDHAAAGNWKLDGHTGGLYCIGVGGGLTGRSVTGMFVVDDPIKGMAEADSPAVREKLWKWWTSVSETRMAPETSVVVIQTRWHPEDLAGRLIAADEELPEDEREWEIVNIPALADGTIRDSLAEVPAGRSPEGWLVSARGRTAELWKKIRRRVGERIFGAMYQGNPVPITGGIFDADWIERHRVKHLQGITLLTTAVAVDPADTGTGDAAGILVGSRALGGDLYVRADLSGQWSQRIWARKTLMAVLRFDADSILQENNLGMGRALRDEWALLQQQALALREADKALGDDPDHLDWAAAASLLLDAAGNRTAANREELLEVIPFAGDILSRPSTGPCEVKTVTPRQSKYVRAKAITGLYETGRAHHVGHLPNLEHQQQVWQPGQASPNELDTLAHLLTHLDTARVETHVAKAAGSTRPGGGGRLPSRTATDPRRGGSRRR